MTLGRGGRDNEVGVLTRHYGTCVVHVYIRECVECYCVFIVQVFAVHSPLYTKGRSCYSVRPGNLGE